MSRKITATRFRLPYTFEQTYTLLYESCRVEVANRHREFRATEEFVAHIKEIAQWLISDEYTFGLFLCGGAGNGKTTIIRAICTLIDFLKSNEGYRDNDYPRRGSRFVNAKEVVRLAKAYNNPTRENIDDCERYKSLRTIEVLCIDDIGTEPRESVHYGDVVTAVMDIISLRYDEQLTTLVTSNLTASEIASYYDERIADRFREMMHIINFGNEQSFRKQ